MIRGVGSSVGRSRVATSGGETKCIMWLSRPLPHLTASYQGHDEKPASHEKGQIRRTQSTQSLSGSRGRKNFSRKLTAALSFSTGLRTAQDGAVSVRFAPRAFEELEISLEVSP